jgi:Tol biopolymer transport system component
MTSEPPKATKPARPRTIWHRVRHILFALFVISAALVLVKLQQSGKDMRWNLPPRKDNAGISTALETKVERIPDDAAFVFHKEGFIYVADAEGDDITQITFERPQGAWEHAAVSPDRRYVVANEQNVKVFNTPDSRSRLWIFDLEKGTRARLAPAMLSAGNGGVDWDRKGFIFFAGKDRDPVETPVTNDDYAANAAASDVWRIRFDGTQLKRLVESKTREEMDVSVSEDGRMLAYVSADPSTDIYDVWVANSDGSHARRAVAGGKLRVASLRSPELSPDNKSVVFSRVNSEVPPNFPDNKLANTANDIYTARLDGKDMVRITRAGPIAIVPDWDKRGILFLDVSDKGKYQGAAIAHQGEKDQEPPVVTLKANAPKWIPAK